MTNQTCKLCLETKELRKSHIFPEFLYKPLYDENHQYKVLITKNDPKDRFKGIYEKLFCENCEAILGEYEDYAAKNLFINPLLESEIKRTDTGFVINDLDYSKLKLFQLSLLWRPSLTIRNEVRRINLGPHAEKIRKMLLEGNPGRYFEYGCSISYLPNRPDLLRGVIIPPHPLEERIEGHRGFRIFISGYFWIYITSSHTEQYSMKPLFLNEDGTLPIFNSNSMGWNFMIKWARELESAQL